MRCGREPTPARFIALENQISLIFDARGPTRAALKYGAVDFRSAEEKKEDEDLHFFKSLLPYFKKLQPLQKLRVRNEFQTILISALDPQQTNLTSNVGYSSSSSNTPLLSPAIPVQPPATPVLSPPEYTSPNPGTSQFGTLHNFHQYF